MSKGWTKKEALELIDRILEDNVPGNKIYQRDGKDIKKLVKILKQIDQYRSYINKLDYFIVQRKKAKGKYYNCLTMVIWGGRKISITKTAIRKIGTEFNKRAAILQELRTLAEDDIKRFREFSLMPHERGGQWHIDHIVPFIQLACDWVQKEGYKSFESLPGKKCYNRFLLKEELKESWIRYHNVNAKLKAIDPKLNMKLSSKNYKAPF